MRELLADNISLYNQLEYFCGHTSGLHPQVCEVPRWHPGFTALRPTWLSLPLIPKPVRCWRIDNSSSARHSGMG